MEDTERSVFGNLIGSGEGCRWMIVNRKLYSVESRRDIRVEHYSPYRSEENLFCLMQLRGGQKKIHNLSH